MKNIISVIFIFLITSSSYSQDSTWQYGYQIGGNLSSFQGDNPYGREAFSNLGFNFGTYVKYAISGLSSIFLELRYVNKGAQWGCSWVPSLCAKSRRSYDASYIELPFYYSATLFRLRDDAELFTVQIGPYISRSFSASFIDQYYDAPGEWVPPTAGRKIEDYVNSYDYGLSFGIQLFHPKVDHLFIRLVLDLSLTPFLKEDLVPESGDSKKMMKSFILFIGIQT